MREVREKNELFLITVITGLVGSYGFAALGLYHAGFVFQLLYSQFILVLPTALYVLHRRVCVKNEFRYHKIKSGTICLAVLFAFLIMPLMQEINLISMLFAQNEISNKIYSVTEGKPFLLSLLVIAGIPAFFEESVYRGCFFNGYSKKSPLKAIFLSALFFGLMHLNFNQFSYAFAMGMVFCFLVEGTDSIFTSMIVHFVINGSSVVMIYLMPMLQKLFSSKAGNRTMLNQDPNNVSLKMLLVSIVVYGIIACFTTVLAFLVYRAMVKHEGRWQYVKAMFKKKEQIEYKESFVTVPMIFAIIICLIYMVINELV